MDMIYTPPMPTPYLNTISDYELAKDAKRKTLRLAVVQQLGAEHFQVVLQFQGDDYYRAMATRRAPKEPRVFKNLDRLLAHLAQQYPQLKEVTIERLTPAVTTVKLRSYRLAAKET